MRFVLFCLPISAACLGGCATAAPVVPIFTPAVREPAFAPPVRGRAQEGPAAPSVRMPLPMPAISSTAAAKPLDRISAANKAAVQEPRTEGYVNAIQIFPYMEGSLYRLYGAPDRVTDIALQAGEQLIAISAGDTSRWTIGNTRSGTGVEARVHVLVKPQLSGLKTNLIIATDRRIYHIQMESTPTTAMAALSWRYPQDELMAMKVADVEAEVKAPIADAIRLEQIHFGYAITGANPSWRPVRAFDDGARVFIEFPDTATAVAPPLFVVGKGGRAQLTNYSVRRNYYIVDGLFEIAELRLGEKPQTVVRITANLKTERGHD